jgi:hypothetical protein
MPAGHPAVNHVPPTNLPSTLHQPIVIGHLCYRLPTGTAIESPDSARAQYVHNRRSEVVVKHVAGPQTKLRQTLPLV